MEIETEGRAVYRLINLFSETQGLISIEDATDSIFIHAVEVSKHNKGRLKQYKGVAGALLAFACRKSFESNYEGFVSFVAKTDLVNHFIETYGAKILFKNRLCFETKESLNLIEKYYK